MKSILIVTGESSGDRYGADVVREFRKAHGDIAFFGVGGERLAEEGVEISTSIKELSAVGIFEVLIRLPQILRVFARLDKEIQARNPAAAILIDSPDFNLRLAKKLRKAGIPVLYYISPTVWAWRYSRVRQIRRWVSRLFVIFPFEVPIYEKEKVTFTYAGHPLLDEVRVSEPRADFRRRHGVGDDDLLLALLPGSRESEVGALLPEIMGAVRRLQKEFPLKVFLQRAQNISPASLAAAGADVRILDQEQGFNLLNAADAVITTCGTSNLEAALLGVPFVAVYRVNRLTYLLGRRLVKIGLYSIVNILAGRRVVTELIQRNCRAGLIYEEAGKILGDRRLREEMQGEFRRIGESLRQEEKPAAIVCRQISAELGPGSA